MTIYVTGGTGFVGRNLVKYLRDSSSVEIRLLTRPLDPQKLLTASNGDAIVHLAGKAHDLKQVSDPAEYYEVNYELTARLYDAFLQSPARKFIFVSSAKAVADHLEGPLTEDVEPAPETDYGRSKLMAEEYLRNQPLPTGKQYYILRPPMIHGPGNKGNLNLLYRSVKMHLPYPLAAFSNRRSFLTVENFCFVIKEILERDDMPAGVYNLADDEALSTNELVKLIGEGSGTQVRLLRLSEKVVAGLARCGDALKLPFNTERLGKLTENFVVSNAKIKGVLGKELPVSARDGIVRTIRSF